MTVRSVRGFWSRLALRRVERAALAQQEEKKPPEQLGPEQIERDRLVQRVLKDVPFTPLEARTLKLIFGFGGHVKVTHPSSLGPALGIDESAAKGVQQVVWEKLEIYLFLLAHQSSPSNDRHLARHVPLKRGVRI